MYMERMYDEWRKNALEVRVKKIHPNAIIPTYATNGSACFDLYAVTPGSVLPGESISIPLGLIFEVPAACMMEIHSRSGDGYKRGLRLPNATGIIDADYRGEICAGYHNDSDQVQSWNAGDRVAQAVIIPIPAINLVESGKLSETNRDNKGFGSTGR